MSYLARSLAGSLVVSAMLTFASHAQEEFPMSARQKAEIDRKKAEEKANDEAYKAMMKRTHDAGDKKVDPWAVVRTPPADSNK
jgi:hypothetical protein